ncbi:Hypothetical protein, putative [Bodo saltans]|uniref:Clu domain-containing protein n=1 Tax=Bodo saltans TaxID=75058 RepID=A0A0S4JT23_BODSA|nr:Hypothetical protein, putative [Bodo saltans]|eukprot:CUG91704.1 Hypothetical protein, putative [Bodo saltans]
MLEVNESQLLGVPPENSPPGAFGRSPATPSTAWPAPLRNTSRRPSIAVVEPSSTTVPHAPSGTPLRRRSMMSNSEMDPAGYISHNGLIELNRTDSTAGPGGSGAGRAGIAGVSGGSSTHLPDEQNALTSSIWDESAARAQIPAEPKMPRSYLLASGPLRHQSTSLDKMSRDWNEEFQALWEVECRPPWSVEGRRQLEKLLRDFDATAKQLTLAVLCDAEVVATRGGVPMSVRAAMSGSSRMGVEQPSSLHRKRAGIRPVAQFPGCFRQGNLLIRRWRNADIGKAVQRTFRSMFEARVPQLHFPLTATFSYMGVVVSVQALLPLADSATTTQSHATVSPRRHASIHGNSHNSTPVPPPPTTEPSMVYRGDAVADTTHTRAAHHYTVRLLEALNLTPHDCGNQWKFMGLEIVEGMDGRYYATNAVGLLPPLFPSHTSPTAHFRLEHLIQYAEPAHYMSSASLERFEEPIADLVSVLPDLVNERSDKTTMATTLLYRPTTTPTGNNKRQQRLVEMLHERYINIALLGRVLTQWLNSAAQLADIVEDAEALDGVTTCLCIEMIARTIKMIISEKASQDEAAASCMDTDYATGYLSRAVASMVRRQQQQTGTQPNSLRTVAVTATASASDNKSASFDPMGNSKFEDALLPILTEKFEISGMEEMDHIRRIFETQHVPITKRLCELLGLTMHRGVVVAIACKPHAHNFSPILSVASELKFSRWIMNEALDEDCPQEVLVSFVLPRRAAIHCRSGAYDKALSLQRKITSRRLKLGSRNFLYFDSLVDTALVAARCNEVEVADALYQRVLDGYDSNASAGAGLVAGSARWGLDGSAIHLHLSRLKVLLQINWANLKVSQSSFREAKKKYNDALDMARHLLSDAVPASMLLSCFDGLIDITAKAPAVQDALALQNQVAISVMRMRPSPRGLDTLRSLSTVLFEGKHFQAAAETLRDAMELCTAVYGPASEEMAVVSNYLSYVYYKWSVPKYGATCRELLSSCQKIMRDLRGVNSAAFLTATNNLIRLQVELGEYTRASAALHRLLRQHSSVRAVPGLSRQHPVYHALQATRELLCSAYREKAVFVLQNAWRDYQEKLLLRDLVQLSVVTIQSCGRGFMSRWRLQVVVRHSVSHPSMSAARSMAYHGSSPMAHNRSRPPGAAATSFISSPQSSFYRGASPSMSMRGASAMAGYHHRTPGSREENPFVFGFSRHLLATSAEMSKDLRDWNEEYQAMVDVVKSSLDPNATTRYEKRASSVRDAFRTAVDRYVRVIEDTPSRAPRAAGSSTAFRFDNVVITQWPGDAVTPFAQDEAMRRVIAAGFPGITAPLLETFTSASGYTYVAQALIPLPRANVEYLRQEDLRVVVLTRKGALHHTILEVLVDQITATEAPDARLGGVGGDGVSSIFTMEESLFRDDLSGNSGILGESNRVQSKGIEVIHGYDDRWYMTNALGLFPTCVWTMETFDNVPKSSAMVLPLLPAARPSIFESCRALVARGRADEALATAEEWVVASQRQHSTSNGSIVAESKRTLDTLLGSTVKAFVVGALGRAKDAHAQLRTAALSLEQRDACPMRAAELWWASGRMLASSGVDYLDSAAMFSRALQLLIKTPNHRVRTLTLLQFVESLLKAHLGNHDAGNAPLPPLEETTVPTGAILRWVSLAAQPCLAKKKALYASSSQPSTPSTQQAPPIVTTSSFSSPPPLITYEVCRRASRYYETRSMWDECIAFASEARRLCMGIYGECSVNYAQDLDRSATLHHQRGDTARDDGQRSLELLQMSVDVMKRAAPDSVELGVLHNKMGAVQLHRFALSAAAQHFRQAHSMLSMRLHHDHREMVALRKNTKQLDMKLHIRSAVRIQSYVRGWLSRHRAQEALRFSDPPAFRRVVAAKFEKRTGVLIHFETSIRLTMVDDEFVAFAEISNEERRMRERARRSGVRRAMQAKYEGLLAERSRRLCDDVIVPHEQLLRAGREWLSVTNAIPHYRAFLLEAHLLVLRQALRERQNWLHQQRRAVFENIESMRRDAIVNRAYVTWAMRLLVWHETHVRRELVADALIAKQEIGEDFAEGANRLLGYTRRFQAAVSKLLELDRLVEATEQDQEPSARVIVEHEEVTARNHLWRMVEADSRQQTPLSHEDSRVSSVVVESHHPPLISPMHTTATDVTYASVGSGADGHHMKLHAATSGHSQWSHGNVPLLYVTSPLHSNGGAPSNTEVEGEPFAALRDDEPQSHRDDDPHKQHVPSLDGLAGSGSRTLRGGSGGSTTTSDHFSPLLHHGSGSVSSPTGGPVAAAPPAALHSNDSFASSLPLPHEEDKTAGAPPRVAGTASKKRPAPPSHAAGTSSRATPTGSTTTTANSTALQSVRPKLSARNLARLNKTLSSSTSSKNGVVIGDGGQPSFMICTTLPSQSPRCDTAPNSGISPLIGNLGTPPMGIGSSGSSSSVRSLAPEEAGPALTPVRKAPSGTVSAFHNVGGGNAAAQHTHSLLLTARGGHIYEESASDLMTSSLNSAAVSFNNSSRSPRHIFGVASPAGPLGNHVERDNPPILEALEANQRRTTERQELVVRNALRDFMLVSYESLLKDHLLLAHPINSADSEATPTAAAGQRQSKVKSVAVSSKPTKPTTPRRVSSGRNMHDAATPQPLPGAAAAAAPTATSTPRRGSTVKASKASKHRHKEMTALVAQESLVRAQLLMSEAGDFAQLYRHQHSTARIDSEGVEGIEASAQRDDCTCSARVTRTGPAAHVRGGGFRTTVCHCPPVLHK